MLSKAHSKTAHMLTDGLLSGQEETVIEFLTGKAALLFKRYKPYHLQTGQMHILGQDTKSSHQARRLLSTSSKLTSFLNTSLLFFASSLEVSASAVLGFFDV